MYRLAGLVLATGLPEGSDTGMDETPCHLPTGVKWILSILGMLGRSTLFVCVCVCVCAMFVHGRAVEVGKGQHQHALETTLPDAWHVPTTLHTFRASPKHPVKGSVCSKGLTGFWCHLSPRLAFAQKEVPGSAVAHAARRAARKHSYGAWNLCQIPC